MTTLFLTASPLFRFHLQSCQLCPSYSLPKNILYRRRPRCDQSRKVPMTCSDEEYSFPRKSDRKMLIVDLQQVLRNEDITEPTNAFDYEDKRTTILEFCELVSLERKKNKKEAMYIIFSSSSNYEASMRSMQDSNLIQPDSLVTLNGTELYQNGYKKPDPYWARQLNTGWEPKPIEWVVNSYFKDEIDKIIINNNINDDFLFLQTITIKFHPDNPSNFDFCQRVTHKLKQMGISARVILSDNLDINNNDVSIIPATSSTSHVVQFCQLMLGIREENTFVFGNDELLNDLIQGKSNVGLVPTTTEQQWDLFDGRVHVSKQHGIKALMDGLYHHAVF